MLIEEQEFFELNFEEKEVHLVCLSHRRENIEKHKICLDVVDLLTS